MDNKQILKLSDDDLKILAHDLRNSMTVMYSYMQVLELSLTNLKLEKEVKIVKDVIAEIREMNILIGKRMTGNEVGKDSSV